MTEFRLTIPETLRDGKNPGDRLLIIGLDGFSYNTVNKFFNEDGLPNICKLMKEGSSGLLESPPPFRSWSGWNCIVSGTNIGKHGFIGPEAYIPSKNTIIPIDTRHRLIKPFWNILSEAGKRVIVLNMPATYPPDRVNGLIISGIGISNSCRSFTYPEYLSEELRKWGFEPFKPREHKEEEYFNQAQKTFDLAKYLMAKTNWDLFMVVFEGTDTFQHHFPLDKIEKFYAIIDNYIGGFLESINDDKTTVMICTDHGMTPYKCLFHVERWLHRQGYLILNDNKKIESQKNEIRIQMAKALKEKKGLKAYVLYKFLKFCEKVKYRMNMPSIPFLQFPEWAMDRKEMTLKGKYARIIDPVDREKSRCFTIQIDNVTCSGGIRVNYRYFRNVTKNDRLQKYDELREGLIEDLKNIQDPKTGDWIFEAIFRREDIYEGPATTRMADIIFVLKDHYRCAIFSADSHDIVNHDFLSDVREIKRSHNGDGIFVLRGKGVKSGYNIKGMKNVDVTPLILYILDSDIPLYMDGRIPEEIFEAEYLENNPIKYYADDGYDKEAIILSEKMGMDRSIEEELVID